MVTWLSPLVLFTWSPVYPPQVGRLQQSIALLPKNCLEQPPGYRARATDRDRDRGSVRVWVRVKVWS